ncbi:hypothetical protein QYE76_070094 [Lolium multiflorum]|uniref:Uncharacterized protein n=1 Tax=Lolium multiflorum TaxID=4521 RepID=A0AAD8SIA3_LOLMU|nr:hypothetical protein QYE76_070094 [Lolium multiflorum]
MVRVDSVLAASSSRPRRLCSPTVRIHGDLFAADAPGAVARPCASPWWSRRCGEVCLAWRGLAPPCRHGRALLRLTCETALAVHLFLVFLSCSCYLVTYPAALSMNELGFGSEKFIFGAPLLSLVDSLAWHQFGDSSGWCVLLSMPKAW